jgi:hypothetical protein
MAQNYVLLERIELNDSAASVTFSNIPQSGYTDLKVVLSARNSGADVNAYITFNGSSSGYSEKFLYGNGSGVGSVSRTTFGFITWGAGVVSSAFTANTFGNSEFYIPNYTSSNYKSISSDSTSENNATEGWDQFTAGLWSNTAAITSITLTPGTGNFVQYSTFSLYGLAAVGTTPVIAPKASGGNIITDGTYWYHTFLTSGTFTPNQSLSCDVLMVAGAGGGGTLGGGGGAGGLLYSASQSLSVASYTLGVGAGGIGAIGSSSGALATQGTNTTFTGLTSAVGGGAGASYENRAGSTGGSGGGQAGTSSNTGYNGTSGQGNKGGNTSSTYPFTGAGGGGNGAAGANVSSANATAGGAGDNTYSSWLSAVGLGVSGYVAGGGGGGCWVNQGAAGAGGSGGGGAGSNLGSVAGVAGAVSSGSGGGSGGFDNISGSVFSVGGSGGSGFIIVRYTIA